MRAVHLLYMMSASNEGRSPQLPYTEFYNKEVSKRADLGQEYLIWRHTLVTSALISPVHAHSAAHLPRPCALAAHLLRCTFSCSYVQCVIKKLLVWLGLVGPCEKF